VIKRKGDAVYLGTKRLGVIYPSRKTFRTWRRKTRHFFRAYNGWGLNEELLEYLGRIGIEWVEIEEKEEHAIYRANLKTIDMKGIIHDNNGETQRILPLPYWDKRIMYTPLDGFTGA